MPSPFRKATLSAAALGVIASGALFTGSASAAPYTDDPTVSVGSGVVEEGGVLSGTLTNFAPLENVDLELHSDIFDLLGLVTDLLGTASYTVQLPDGVCGAHELVAVGAITGEVRTPINIACDDDDDDDDDEDGGSLPRTGAAVAGFGVAGLGLLGGGSLMMRRRRNRA